MKEPMQATRIIAIRHGETTWNTDGRIQGHTDVPLNDTGRWQAAQAGMALEGEPIAAIYASDLKRAYATGQAIADATGAPITAEPALRERAFGSLEGRTFDEVQQTEPDIARRWSKREPEFAPPEGGESLLQLRERISEVTNRLAAQHPGELIVLVAHGGVLDALYRAATRLEIQSARTWLMSNAAINRLLWTPDSGLSLVGWADTQHLDQASRDETVA